MTDETPTVRRSLLIDDAARTAGVTRRTIYNWLTAGRLQTLRTHGGSLRIYVDSLPRLKPPKALTP